MAVQCLPAAPHHCDLYHFPDWCKRWFYGLGPGSVVKAWGNLDRAKCLCGWNLKKMSVFFRFGLLSVLSCAYTLGPSRVAGAPIWLLRMWLQISAGLQDPRTNRGPNVTFADRQLGCENVILVTTACFDFFYFFSCVCELKARSWPSPQRSSPSFSVSLTMRQVERVNANVSWKTSHVWTNGHCGENANFPVELAVIVVTGKYSRRISSIMIPAAVLSGVWYLLL